MMPTRQPAYAPQPTPTVVSVAYASRPLPVLLVPDRGRTALMVFAVVLGVLHAIACLVFLYAMYSIYSGINHLEQQFSQLPGVGG